MPDDNNVNSIILIEDNPVDVDLTLRAFKMRNLSNPIIVLRDGEEAIRWMEKLKDGAPLPVVILLDLKLPKYSGLEVLKYIKSSETLNGVPVVVLTTSSEDDDVKQAYKLGVNSYVLKPVDFEKFIDVAVQIELYWSVLNKPGIR
ncbi:response regulator [Carboxylicivirga caseinilyticus]|uniref:response regulator n=1 Tax=Carboxylicivirga caseinilyticus TaxID=3417572 RepID=UPI003D34CDFA|nr:response regulator [Marinilabiliaceae bacterium A049]